MDSIGLKRQEIPDFDFTEKGNERGDCTEPAEKAPKQVTCYANVDEKILWN